jgi:asparagine synthase (glutamine-hydrolysing)
VTVALSGDGGDEVFAGYNRYVYGARTINAALRTPAVVRQLASATIGQVSSQAWDRAYNLVAPAVPAGAPLRLFGSKLQKVGSLIANRSAATMYRSLLSAWQDPEALTTSGRNGYDPVESAFESLAGASLLDRMQVADQKSYLADDLLAKLDRISMAVSMEARVPLLDHRVVEFAWALPASMKVRAGAGKWVLREVLDRYVPRQIVDRPKMGFSVPIAAWLRGPLREWAGDLLSEHRLRSDGFLRYQEVDRAWRALQSGRDDAALRVWTVVMYQMWREHWAGGAALQA